MPPRKSPFADRIALMERIVRMFWPERIIGIFVGLAALGLIVTIFVRSMLMQKADEALIGALAGSATLITAATAQTFFMFSRALALVEPVLAEPKAPPKPKAEEE